MADQARENMRVSDADRASVAEILKGAVDEGRLSLGEYDERLQTAYQSKTYGELDQVVVDLPVQARPESQVPAKPADQSAAAVSWSQRRRMATMWLPWVGVSTGTTAIWAITAVSSGPYYFWPVWVMVPWGLVLAMRTVGHVAFGLPQYAPSDPESRAERAEHRAERHETKCETQLELKYEVRETRHETRREIRETRREIRRTRREARRRD